MVPVQARSRAVMSELQLVLHLVARDFLAGQRVSCLRADFYLIGHDLASAAPQPLELVFWGVS